MNINTEVLVCESVSIDGDVMRLSGLEVQDAVLAAFMLRLPVEHRKDSAERALRIGLIALEAAGASIDLDHVRRSFEGFQELEKERLDLVTQSVLDILNTHFDEKKGTVSATLQSHLGEKGTLQAQIKQLFDENHSGSVMSTLNAKLEDYFVGDDAKMAALLNAENPDSPVHKEREEFRQKVEDLMKGFEKLRDYIENKGKFSIKGTQKGVEFEKMVIDRFAEIVSGSDDLVQQIGSQKSESGDSKKGDGLIDIDGKNSLPGRARIVIEVKNRTAAITVPKLIEEVKLAKDARQANTALVIFNRDGAAPVGYKHLQVIGGDVFCEVDVDHPEIFILSAAYRLAKIQAEMKLKQRSGQISEEDVSEACRKIRSSLRSFATIRSSITSAHSAIEKIESGLGKLEKEVTAEVEELELVLRPQEN